MTHPFMNRALPSWAMSSEDNFLRFGLLAERKQDGSTSCNIHVIGGLAGKPIAPLWGAEGAEVFLLALSVVNTLFGHPDTINALMAKHVTEKFRFMSQMTTLLPDGVRVPAPYLVLAKELMRKRMGSNSGCDANTLTIPIEDLIQDLALIVRIQYAD